ncbi:transglutaminase TgpA family protein [Amphritea sp.]|uniref:transglutaminase TgpA family protein n=1 Tax=Amphritea sp. TaxID=1872502 RepID=UPI003D126945
MKPLFQLTRSSMIWLLVTILMVMTPYITVVPVWLFLLALLTVGWRLMVHSGRWNFPHWSVRSGLLLLVLVGLLLELRSGSVMVVTVGLLVAAFLLKLMEMYHRRDALVVLYVALLLIVCSFLFFQSIPMALYSLLSLMVVTACLNTVYRSQQNSDVWRPLKRSAVLYLQALPMMLVLFLIFPRIGPLWQVDMNTGQSFTGLSDSISPGDVSRLTRSAEIAFRARFDEQLPPENQRYWRGLTYDRFDGQRWSRSQQLPGGGGDTLANTNVQLLTGPEYRYQMTMEATGQPWRYALDLPFSYPVSMQRISDMTLQGKGPLMQRMQYRLRSRFAPLKESLSAARIRDYLQLPEQGNDKARQLALQWRSESLDAQGVSTKMLGFFASDFRYTLEPPLLTQRDRMDQFLFQTRQGFCGHFASAGVFLLRAAGIPARVVGGYLGGELNPLDGALTVRQYEAHAWLEYWDSESLSWHRLDPTSVVAPLRLEQPAAQLFSSEPAFLADAMLMRNGFLNGALLKQLRLRYEAINYGWHRWVLNFHERQSGFLQQLIGDISVVKVILLLLLPGGLVLLAVAGSLFIRRGPHRDSLQQALQQLDKRLLPFGLQRHSGETTGQFFARLARSYPSLSDEFAALSHCYEQVRYAENPDPQLEQDFRRMMKRCCTLITQ